MKKVSVIIPCYNAADCIDRCIRSLVGQTIGMEQLELIFVNDASTDDTLKILCKLEQEYPDSVLVVDCAENGRQGTARNIGLGYATAEYVGFMDHDDMAQPDMFRKLYDCAVACRCDMVVCHAKKHTVEQAQEALGRMGQTGKESRLIELETEADRNAFLDMDLNRAVWNKLYKRSVIEEYQIFFPAGIIYDDIYFSELIKHYVNRIFLLEEVLYHHIIDPGAASYNTGNWLNRLGYFDVQVLLLQSLRERGIYRKYRTRYEDLFVLEYITFVRNFIKTYQDIPCEILNAMNEQITELFPDYDRLPLIGKLRQAGSGTFLRLLADGWGKQARPEDIGELVRSLHE